MKHIVMTLIIQHAHVTLFASMLLGIVGFPVPDELLLLFAGATVKLSVLSFIGLIVSAWLGSVIGMNINYYLGRTIGITRISKVTKWIGLPESRLKYWAHRFQKYGGLMILTGFFVGGLRHASPFIAGASGMPYKRFAGFAYTGSMIWITFFLMLGKKFGPHAHKWFRFIHHPSLLLGIAAVLAAGWLLKKHFHVRVQNI